VKLSSINVNEVFMDCLFAAGEETITHVVGKGILNDFAFHPERLEKHRDEIKAMLLQLPETFYASKGGGWSFLNACMTQEGEQWGEHESMQQLLALGTATEDAKIMLPHDMWDMLPGGMPYFSVAA